MNQKVVMTAALEFDVSAKGFAGFSIYQRVAIRNNGLVPILVHVTSIQPDLYHVNKPLVIIAPGSTIWIECVADFPLAMVAYSHLIGAFLEHYTVTAAFVTGVQQLGEEGAELEQAMAKVPAESQQKFKYNKAMNGFEPVEMMLV